MLRQTPQFDRVLAEYFSKLTLDASGAQERICRLSGERFYVRPEDIAFYREIGVPLPTLKPSERMRRRLAYSSGYNLFRVSSATSGKPVISVYPPNTPYKIYEHEIWFSDQWNPLEFGRIPDMHNDFFSQFHALQRAVPRPNLNNDSSNVNSNYVNNSIYLKNCYMTFDSLYGENLYYFECCLQNKDCMDSWSMNRSDTCYKCWGDDLWRCFFCEYTFDSRESWFLYDCRNCDHCFMSANLRNKQYYFNNEPLTKEEYAQRLNAINLGDYAVLQEYLEKFQELKKRAIKRENFNERAINSTGDWIYDSKDCHNVMYIYESQRVAYALGGYKYRDSYDICGGQNAERCYELMTISTENNYGIKFSTAINNSHNLEYCDLCLNCSNCFGCVGLRNKQFCILNKQYSETTYWETLDALKTAMLSRGEYGEFFPPGFSPLPYNIALIASYPGYRDEEEAERMGYRTERIVDATSEQEHREVVSAADLPNDIKNVDNSILDKIIVDAGSGKKFRITPYELEFYRKHNLPLPRMHPVTRMAEWRKFFNLRGGFYETHCVRCDKAIQAQASYNPPGANIHCLRCYHAAIA